MKKTYRRWIYFVPVLIFAWTAVLYAAVTLAADIWYNPSFYYFAWYESMKYIFVFCLVWQVARAILCRAEVTSEEFRVYPNLLAGILQKPVVYPLCNITSVERKGLSRALVLKLNTQHRPEVVRCRFLGYIALKELEGYLGWPYNNGKAQPPQRASRAEQRASRAELRASYVEQRTSQVRQEKVAASGFELDSAFDSEAYYRNFIVDTALIKRQRNNRILLYAVLMPLVGLGVPFMMAAVNGMLFAFTSAEVMGFLWYGAVLLGVGLFVGFIVYKDTRNVPSTVTVRAGRIYLDDECYAMSDINRMNMTPSAIRTTITRKGGTTTVLRRLIIRTNDGRRRAYYFGTVFKEKEDCKNYEEIYYAIKQCYGKPLM